MNSSRSQILYYARTQVFQSFCRNNILWIIAYALGFLITVLHFLFFLQLKKCPIFKFLNYINEEIEPFLGCTRLFGT
jgi:hypothetical protein